MKIKKRTVILSAMLAFHIFLLGTASATTNMECQGINSDASVSILFGAGPLLSALEVDVSLGGKVISTRGRDGAEAANILQFSADTKELRLDLMDDQAEQHLASIRLLRHLDDEDNDGGIQIGLLKFKQFSPVGVTCIGP